MVNQHNRKLENTATLLKPPSVSTFLFAVYGRSQRRLRSLCAALLFLAWCATSTCAAAQTGSTEHLRDGERRIEVNGIAHWVKVAGAAHGSVPIVIVHGGPGGNNYNFEHTTGPRLEQFSTVIYYEQRGSGRSAQPAVATAYSIPLLVSDLDALREQLGVKKMVLLGYSFGGQLVLEYALAHPEHVAGLILEAPSLDLFDERTQATQVAGFGVVAKGEMRNEITRIMESTESTSAKLDKIWSAADADTADHFLFHNIAAAQMNRRMWGESKLTNTGDMYKALRTEGPRRPALLQQLPNIHLPTIVIVGLFDHNVGVDANRDIASSIPGATLFVFDESGHFTDMEQPQKFVGVVHSFYRNLKN